MRAALLLLGLSLAFACPATASPVEVGASGQCYDAAGNGGEDAVRVGTDTTNVAGASASAPSGTGAAAALAQAAGYYAMGPGCSDAAGFRSADYIEGHARVGDTFVQLCYDDRANGPLPDPANVGLRAFHVDGSCPTSTGAPGP